MINVQDYSLENFLKHGLPILFLFCFCILIFKFLFYHFYIYLYVYTLFVPAPCFRFCPLVFNFVEEKTLTVKKWRLSPFWDSLLFREGELLQRIDEDTS
jgi:hypothetical protein